MPRTKSTIKKSHPALRSAPIPGAGVVRRTKSKSPSHLFTSLSTTNSQARQCEQQHHHLPAPQGAKVRQADARHHVRAEEPGAGGGGSPAEAGLDGAGERD